MLEIEHRVVIPNRGLDQPIRVNRVRRSYDFEPGNVREPSFRILAVKRPAVNSSARRSPDHHWDRHPVAIVQLRRHVHYLIESAGDEVHELHLGYRPLPHEGRADRGTNDG